VYKFEVIWRTCGVCIIFDLVQLEGLYENIGAVLLDEKVFPEKKNLYKGTQKLKSLIIFCFSVSITKK